MRLLAWLWRHFHPIEGRFIFSLLLLAALSAAPVMALLKTLPPNQDVGKWLHQYLEESLKPLATPRAVRSQVYLLHLALRHMLGVQRRKRRRSLRRSPLFADALNLLEIHCLATKRHRSALDRWQHPPVQRKGRRAKGRAMSPARNTTAQSGEV